MLGDMACEVGGVDGLGSDSSQLGLATRLFHSARLARLGALPDIHKGFVLHQAHHPLCDPMLCRQSAPVLNEISRSRDREISRSRDREIS